MIKVFLLEFKTFLLKVWAVTLSPTTAWEKIFSDQSKDEKLLVRYVTTLILCVVAATFLGELTGRFLRAFMRAIVTGIAYSGGFWCTFYLLTTGLKKYLNLVPDKIICLQLLVYSSAFILFISIITSLIPPLFFLKILNIYTIYIVWEGVGSCFKFEEKYRGNVALLFSAGLLLFPFVIEKILLFILPVAR